MSVVARDAGSSCCAPLNSSAGESAIEVLDDGRSKKAAMAATKELKMGGSSYGEDVVIVANDWHAALVPMYVKLAQAKGEWKDCRTAALLHNMVFQGRFPDDGKAAKRLGLTEDFVESMSCSLSYSMCILDVDFVVVVDLAFVFDIAFGVFYLVSSSVPSVFSA